MNRLCGSLLFLVFGAAVLIGTARAASTEATYLVVSSCGTPTYTAGKNVQGTMDVHGNICGSSSGGGGGAVSIADGSDVAQGAKADAAATDSTSAWTIIALLKGMLAQQLSTNPIQVYSGDLYARITTNGTTVVKNAPGTAVAFVVNSAGTTETVTVYDNTAGSGTNPFTFVLTGLAVGTRISMNAKFGTGITVVTSGGAACDITFLFE